MTTNPLNRLIRFWESDWSLSFLLFFLVAAVFVALPASELSARRWLLDISSSLVLISGAWAVSKHRAATVLVTAVTLAGLVVHWSTYLTTATPLVKIDATLTLIALLLMAAVVTAKVFQKGPITMHRVQGAIVVYLLLGLAWSRAYALVEMLSPGAFQMGSTAAAQFRAKLIYYSFVTLTTTGYGDITAVHPVARSLSIMEALVGQLFPSILIARLVALELEQSKRHKSDD